MLKTLSKLGEETSSTYNNVQLYIWYDTHTHAHTHCVYGDVLNAFLLKSRKKCKDIHLITLIQHNTGKSKYYKRQEK